MNIDCIKEAGVATGCETILKEGNSFSNNYATVRGGAISYSSQGIIEEDDSSTYLRNSAGSHSDVIAAFGDVLLYDWDPEGAVNVTIEEVEVDRLQRAQETKLEVIKRETLSAMKRKYGFAHYLTVPSG